MTEQLSNFGTSQLLNSIASDATSLTLVANGGADFPSVGDFRIRIEDELILCSSRTGDVIQLVERGIEDTTATTHASGEAVYQIVTLQGLTNFISEHTDAGETGPEGESGKEHIILTQRGQARLSTGSKPFPLPYDADILFATPFCGTPPTEDPIEMDLKVDNVSILTDPASVPVGAYFGTQVIPTDDPYVGMKGDLLTADVTSVGAPEEGGDVVLDVRSVSVGVSSTTATKSSFNIPIPASYQVGDLLLCPFVTLFTTVSVIPPNWVELVEVVEETSHANSLHVYVLGKIAQASESAVQSVVFAGGTPMEAVTLALANPQVIEVQPDDQDEVQVGTAGQSATLPVISSSLDNDIGIWVYGTRFFEGITDTIGIDSDLTLDYTHSTTRSTQLNCGLAVGHKLFPLSDTSDAYEATVGGAIFARWVGRNMMLFQGNAGGTPGADASLDVWFQERT